MRSILRTSGWMGAASAVSIGAGVGRAKLMAILVGAEGIGLFGLYQSFQGLASALAGLGLPASGVREVARAEAAGEKARLEALRRVLWVLPLVTGGLTAALCWLARRPLAGWMFDDSDRSGAVVVLGLGVAALTVSLCQTAWINGRRRIRLLARLRVLGAVASAAIAVTLVWRLGLDALAWAVAGGSLAALALSSWAWRAARSPRPGPAPAVGAGHQAARRLLRLGLPLMMAGLLTPATHLVVRAVVLRQLGVTSLGHWQAAWSLSMIYVGFVLAAMAVDYVPRLSAAADRPAEMARLVDAQARAALLLAGPAILAMLAAAPLLVRLLYSPAFEPAVSILSWQLVGDFFKVPAWALAGVFAAAGRGGAHLLAEALWNVPFLALVWFGTERFGLTFCGIAFLLSYALYFGGLWIANRRAIGLVWSRATLGLLAGGIAAALLLRWLPALGGPGIAAQVAIVLAFALFSFYRIRQELAVDDDT